MVFILEKMGTLSHGHQGVWENQVEVLAEIWLWAEEAQSC